MKNTFPLNLAIKEQQIQNGILQYLNYHPKIAWCMRVNAGMIRTERGGLVRLAPSGVSDIIGMLNGGRFFAIEVKNKKAYNQINSKSKRKNNLSEYQYQFLKKIDKDGGMSCVVCSIEQIEKILNDIN